MSPPGRPKGECRSAQHEGAAVSLPVSGLRYAAVGALGAAVHIALLVGAVEGLGLHPVAGSVLGFLGALAVSYRFNRHWTFRSDAALAGSLARYTAVSLLGLLLNTGLMVALMGWARWPYLPAQAVAAVLVPICNFLLNRHWSFALARRPA